ncbi:flagellar hook assembly protein FlgD [Siminovitchia acidinfaciens]|uniref:Basal-body rod modification protein FlgD n=1 Tax=Siminovitchia acidinfaciens TaxID=2321395 RepID=A0A429Y2M0_9BACI|nr:flagellar hook assembly protein FlgD [Siminovitchia acidinfaciens]RST75489.1 flagellar hook assembly protein FlgD [Siminovitchia acidinfaciens]
MPNTIGSDYFLPTETVKRQTGNNDSLGKDAFLKILFTQLQNQDPLSPMDDKEFIGQMATFSSLEQLTNMNQTLEKFVESASQANLISFSEFVGKEVTWHQIIESNDPLKAPEILEGKGVVRSVQFLGDSVKIILEDGQELAPANISEIHQNGGDHSLVTASHLIGKKVSWMDDEQEKSGLVKSVTSKGGIISVILEDGTVIESKSLTKIE